MRSLDRLRQHLGQHLGQHLSRHLGLHLAGTLLVGAGYAGGCADETKADGISVDLSKISGGKSSKRARKPDEGGSTGEASGSSDGETPKPKVDPVEFCRTQEMTVTKSEADRNRRPGTAESSDCPVSIDNPRGYPPLTLRASATEMLRDAGDDEHCCYEVIEALPTPGRPLVVGGRSWLPEFSIGPGTPGAVEPDARRAAMGWLRDARAEAASIASFRRAAAELAAIGAPRGLVQACRDAADDERRHAAMCLSVARRLAGRSLSLGDVPSAAARPGDLVALLQRTFLEGCVPETIAAHEAERALRRTTDVRIRAVLQTIAADETRHAALAWATIGWGLSRLDAASRDAWVSWARARGPMTEPVADGELVYGRWDRAGRRAIAHAVWSRCITALLDDASDAVASAHAQGTHQTFCG